MFKLTTHIYRDCLRTIEHMSGRSAKGRQIAAIVRQEFKKNKDITDEKEIESLRKNATASLANYLTLQSLSQLRHTDSAGNPLQIAAEREAEEDDDDEEEEEVWMNEHGDILTEEEAMAIQQGKPLPGRNALKDAEVQSDTSQHH